MSAVKVSGPVVSIAALVAGFLGVYWFLVLPQVAEWGSAQKRADAALAAKAAIKKADSTADVAALRRQVDTLVPLGDRQYDLSVQMTALAAAAGVNLTSLVFTPSIAATGTPTAASAAAPAGSPFPVLKVSLSATGSYDALQGFVTGLTKLDRFVTVNQASIGVGSAQAGQAGTMSVQIDANAYYLPEPAASAPAS